MFAFRLLEEKGKDIKKQDLKNGGKFEVLKENELFRRKGAVKTTLQKLSIRLSIKYWNEGEKIWSK